MQASFDSRDVWDRIEWAEDSARADATGEFLAEEPS